MASHLEFAGLLNYIPYSVMFGILSNEFSTPPIALISLTHLYIYTPPYPPYTPSYPTLVKFTCKDSDGRIQAIHTPIRLEITLPAHLLQ